MGRTFNGTNQWLSKGAALAANVPVTFAGFCYFNAPFQDAIIVGQGIPTGTAGPGCHAYYQSGLTQFEAEAFGDVDDEQAHTTTVPSLVTWYHVAAVFASTTSRKIYLNGVMEGSSTVTVNLTGTMTDTRVGNICLNLSNFTMNGMIASAGIWTAALADSEVAGLAAGFSPKLIRASALAGYCRMLGGFNPEPDFVKGTWALAGTPTFTDVMNPRLYNP